MLIKTLCIALGTSNPTCTTQGPICALCTIAAFVVLLGLTVTPQLALSRDMHSGVQVLSVKPDQGFSLVVHKYQVEQRSRLM